MKVVENLFFQHINFQGNFLNYLSPMALIAAAIQEAPIIFTCLYFPLGMAIVEPFTFAKHLTLIFGFDFIRQANKRFLCAAQVAEFTTLLTI